jgi:VanZ family protein
MVMLYFTPRFDPFPTVEIENVPLDYLLHLILFSPWMPLSNCLHCLGVNRGKRSVLTWFFIGLIVASGFEIMHIWLPYRSFNLLDMALNICGLIIGFAALLFRKYSS